MNKRQKEVLEAQLKAEQKTLEKLKKSYKTALDDIDKNIGALLARTDKENLQSIIYQVQYQKALKTQISGILDQMNAEQFETISDYLTNCYEDGFFGTVYDLHGQGIPLIIPIDQRQVISAITNDTKLSKSLYDSVGESVTKLKHNIQRNLSRGIAQGQSYADITRNIAREMVGDYSKFNGGALYVANRIARTEGHRIQNQATIDVQNKAKEKGADIVKQWDATLDKRTRPAHAAADGQLREIDEDFDVWGEKLKAPGIGGSAKNVIHCRCVSLQRAKWALDEDELKTLEERAKYYGLDKTKDFEDFKEKYLKAADEQTPEFLKKKEADIQTDVWQKEKELENTEKQLDIANKKDYNKYDGMSKNDIREKQKLIDDEYSTVDNELSEWQSRSKSPKIEDFPDTDEGFEQYSEAKRKYRQERKVAIDRLTEREYELEKEFDEYDRALKNWDEVEDYRKFSKNIPELEQRRIELNNELVNKRKELKEIQKQLAEAEKEAERIKKQAEEAAKKAEEAAKKAAKEEAIKNAKIVKIGGVECKKYDIKHGFGDGTANGIKKTVDATIYRTEDGVEFVFPKNIDKAKQSMTPEKALELWNKVPEEIRKKAPPTIEFVDYYNPQDSYWKKRYKNFTHSYATGGKDRIAFYRCNYHDEDYVIKTYCHETGHVIDQNIKTASGIRFCDDAEWTKAMADDLIHSGIKSPTVYGQNANVEDLAESVAEFVANPEEFEKKFPNRTKIIKRITGIK